jgi:hypothetical protein
MDTKTLVKALKVAVREVIKEELTEILREGLQSTITEMKQSTRTSSIPVRQNTPATKRKPTVQFQENKWASVLNQTEPLIEDTPIAMNSFSDIMNEGVDTMSFTSQDARGFGELRNNISRNKSADKILPPTIHDPETGKVYEVPESIENAMMRDYSSLFKKK